MDTSPVAPGRSFTLAVRPPPAYAGAPGTRAVVESVSSDAITVQFETGVRESFPPGRFAAYFVAPDGDDARYGTGSSNATA